MKFFNFMLKAVGFIYCEKAKRKKFVKTNYLFYLNNKMFQPFLNRIMCASSTFFLLVFFLLVPTVNALRCYNGTEHYGLEVRNKANCPPSTTTCVKAACVLIDGTTTNTRDCINEHLERCGSTIEGGPFGKCTFHCCTGDLCNGVMAMKPTAIGRAVLVPLIITALGFLF